MNISILSIARMLAWNWHHDRCSLWKKPSSGRTGQTAGTEWTINASCSVTELPRTLGPFGQGHWTSQENPERSASKCCVLSQIVLSQSVLQIYE